MFSLISIAFSQTNCPTCTTDSISLTKQINFSQFICIDTIEDDYGHKYLDTIIVPVRFVLITYREINCNGNNSLLIDDVVFIDESEFYRSYGGVHCVVRTPIVDVINLAPDPTYNDIKDAIRISIDSLISESGLETSIDLYFKGACNSLVTLKFPEGTFFSHSPNDLGVYPDTTWLHENTTITQTVPCNDTCCKVTYEYQIVSATNGETKSKFVPVSLSGNSQNCSGHTPINYDTYPYRLIGKKINPSTGAYETSNYTEISFNTCEIICVYCTNTSSVSLLKRSFITDKLDSNYKNNFELNTWPTLFNNFIKFQCSEKIEKLAIYDASGNNILNTNLDSENLLHTESFKTGLYYIQIFLPSDIIKTIKVIKE
jgi:hypothetical protein